MNIVFFHNNGIVPTLGGISRITDILGTLFASKGNNIWYIGAQDKHKGQLYRKWQSFLPSPNLFVEENVNYLVDFVKKHKVDAIINQFALDPRSSQFLAHCKTRVNFMLVSCIHNSILTPVMNGAYLKEYVLKKKGFNLLFLLMKTRFVTSIMTSIYISKHRKRYLDIVHNSDRIVVLCDGQESELNQMCGESFPKKVKVIPNCIDTSIVNPQNKGKIVLWVGNFDYAIKRPDNMLQIWKFVEDKNSDWELQMLGDGPSWNEMKALANCLSLKRVCFLGRVCPEEYYKKASILCVTSVHESFSLVTVEAQRVGCIPILNNSFRPAPMLVKDGYNGYLIPPFNNIAFAKTLDSLMRDSELRGRMSKNAIESVKRFSLDTVYIQWMSMLNDN